METDPGSESFEIWKLREIDFYHLIKPDSKKHKVLTSLSNRININRSSIPGIVESWNSGILESHKSISSISDWCQGKMTQKQT